MKDELVEVTQAHQDAAARLWMEITGDWPKDPCDEDAQTLAVFAQAFARFQHRIASSPVEEAPADVAAWRDYTSAPLSFDGGGISVNRDGSGYFCVNEKEADWEADDESAATYIVAKFSAGEAQEIRDHLNKYFPTRLSADLAEARKVIGRIAEADFNCAPQQYSIAMQEAARQWLSQQGDQS